MKELEGVAQPWSAEAGKHWEIRSGKGNNGVLRMASGEAQLPSAADKSPNSEKIAMEEPGE
jgi:hypothetical protein